VGKSILESYSRVLESLASNIIARIDDLLNVDELSKQSDSIPSAGTATDAKIACKSNSNKIGCHSRDVKTQEGTRSGFR